MISNRDPNYKINNNVEKGREGSPAEQSLTNLVKKTELVAQNSFAASGEELNCLESNSSLQDVKALPSKNLMDEKSVVQGAPLQTLETVRTETFAQAIEAVNSERCNFPLAFCPSNISKEQLQKIQNIDLSAFPQDNDHQLEFEKVVYWQEDLEGDSPLPSLQSKNSFHTKANWKVLDEHILPVLESLREQMANTAQLFTISILIIPKGDPIAEDAERWHKDTTPKNAWTRTVITLRGPTTEFCALPINEYEKRNLSVSIQNKTTSDEIDTILKENPEYHLRSELGEISIFNVQDSNTREAIPKEGDVVHKAPPVSSIQDVRIFVAIDVNHKTTETS